jgi:hemerythrin-like metal-binding protein
MKNGNWTSRLETGVSELDTDNRSLLDLVRRVKAKSDEAPLSELKSALLAFHAEMTSHFEREERLMAECNYQAVADHREEHRKLAAEVQEQLTALEACEARVAAIGHFMHNWIVGHIADMDGQLGKAIVTQSGTTDRRQDSGEEFDIFEERRLGNLGSVRWTSGLAVGVDSIDADHRIMIELLNEIIGARQLTDRARLATLLERFGDETARHFRSEEALMAHFGAEHTSAHIEEHRQLLDEFAQQVDDWRADRISAELLCRFMYRWILRHIQTADIPLGMAIRRNDPGCFASPPSADQAQVS